MKKVLLVAMVSGLFCSLYAQDIAITESKANFLKSQCNKSVRNYYNEMSLLMGSDFTADEKNEITVKTQDEFFRNADTRIESDIKRLPQQDYNAQEYLENIALLYSKVDNAEVSPNNIAVSEIFYNNSEHYYFLVATVEREIITTKNDKKATTDNDKKLIDIYFNFTGNSKLKIYSIQNHRVGVLKGLNPVSTISEGDAHKKSGKIKPYFVFEINPLYADVYLDGKTLYNYGGDKIITTPGKHNIEITAPRYNSLKFEITVSDTGLHLVKRQLVSKNGLLSVKSNEKYYGARVYVDGEFADEVPLSNYSLPVGFHKIVIKKKGYFNFNKTVNITDDKNTVLFANPSSNKWVKGAAVGVGAAILYGILKH